MVRLLRAERKYLVWLIGAMVAGVVGAGVQVGFAWAIRGLTTGVESQFLSGTSSAGASGVSGVSGGYAENPQMYRWLAGIGVLFLLMGVISAVGRYLSGRYAALVMKSLREKAAGKLIRVCLPEIERGRTGDTLSLMGNDLGQIGQYVEDHLPGIAYHVAWFSLAFASALVMSWQLLILSFAVVPVIMLGVSVLGKPLQVKTQSQNEALGKAGTLAQDTVSGQVEIKAFGLQRWLSERHGYAVNAWVTHGESVLRSRILMEMANFMNVLLPIVIMAGMGALFVLQGKMTAADVVGFITLSNGLMNPLIMLGQLVAETRKASGACGRLHQLMALPEERRDGSEPDLCPDVPLVEIRNLRFSYPAPVKHVKQKSGTAAEAAVDESAFEDRQEGKEEWTRQEVFDGFNLTLRAGERVALVGGSGSGKSTLLKLVAGLYDPDGGEIRFGGHPLTAWSLPALRKRMAMVQQETCLFPGTLEENIAVGGLGTHITTSEHMMGRIREAAGMARIREFIEALPNGYGTEVGERGARLSGGQRQRVAIARAALRDATLLLLDEPTSALDTATEQAVQQELDRLMEGRTTLVVAHRLSTIRGADRILVLDAGCIVEEGTHNDLMRRHGRYWELVSAQEGGEACA